jgi:creatinine amidohydrolase/Fe(II)-dependent formamide hydrolase-like protein
MGIFYLYLDLIKGSENHMQKITCFKPWWERQCWRRGRQALAVMILFLASSPVLAAGLWLNDLTWPEVKAAQKAGAKTVIIPTAGTEQNGPHMVLGKHHYVVSHAAERIAGVLGNTLIAPVLDYAPEGSITPPEGHMAFPGTLSLRESTFEAVLEDTARSLKQHGFRRICFLGDSGPNQAPQARVAERLNKEWAAEGVRVLAVASYYDQNKAQAAWLQGQGESAAAIGTHAGILDTSQLLAVRPGAVRRLPKKALTAESGVDGDPRHAHAEYGRHILQARIDAAVAEIRQVPLAD